MPAREPYRVVLSRLAQRDIRRLPPEVSERTEQTIKRLARVPRPAGCRKLAGQATAYRIRVGDYRVIYDVFDGPRLVEVLRVQRRGEGTYRLRR